MNIPTKFRGHTACFAGSENLSLGHSNNHSSEMGLGADSVRQAVRDGNQLLPTVIDIAYHFSSISAKNSHDTVLKVLNVGIDCSVE